MAVTFLSEEWARERHRRLEQSRGLRVFRGIGSADLGIQSTVSDGPQGVVDYYLKASGGTAELALGELEGADVTVSNDYTTATAISKGELNTQMAFMQGKLKVGGNLAKLMMHQSAVQDSGVTPSPVWRSSTETVTQGSATRPVLPGTLGFDSAWLVDGFLQPFAGGEVRLVSVPAPGWWHRCGCRGRCAPPDAASQRCRNRSR